MKQPLVSVMQRVKRAKNVVQKDKNELLEQEV
jgi:hypothetical protein